MKERRSLELCSEGDPLAEILDAAAGKGWKFFGDWDGESVTCQ